MGKRYIFCLSIKLEKSVRISPHARLGVARERYVQLQLVQMRVDSHVDLLVSAVKLSAN